MFLGKWEAQQLFEAEQAHKATIVDDVIQKCRDRVRNKQLQMLGCRRTSF